MARKILPEDYRANNQVTFALSRGERNALTEEARRLEITKADLLRGVLFGTYSVKDVIVGSKDETNCIIHISLTTEERRLIDEVAMENKTSISKLIRGIFYETA